MMPRKQVPNKPNYMRSDLPTAGGTPATSGRKPGSLQPTPGIPSCRG